MSLPVSAIYSLVLHCVFIALIFHFGSFRSERFNHLVVELSSQNLGLGERTAKSASETLRQSQNGARIAGDAGEVSVPSSLKSNVANEESENQKLPNQRLSSAEELYLRNVRSILEANKTYPLLARKKKTEGKVYLRFVVESSGKVSDIAVAKSSGSEILDEAAVSLIKELGTLPSFPRDVPQKNWSMYLPLEYQL